MAALPISPAAAAATSGAVAAPRASFGAALRAQVSALPCAAPAPHPARAALAAVEQARQRLDAVLAAARRGRTFSAHELLALQADAYRYSQTVEVASRVVEQGAQSVKQAVNTQV
ncbi:hypothetical protein [Anaeromyxobacter diazotrophicus]|uniref:Uncharacterized protein n=1 Tax=Anaeromyxobacter diazotrophicus TaxID=2590199 RepID=A0A7I9VHE5_9BACT|nr:hypothetical protein [Anaeromyxobacter diazotrophicus]GEJ55568.1 hypothetical protein AMYX_03090 [Anaeromyxobacter diazotrophicus]